MTGMVHAQKAPIKFGNIDIRDLEMTTYHNDTTAPAVILCDYGYFDARNIMFTRIIRIKILKKEGYNWANRVFSTSSKSDIKGVTFNLVDGKIVETKLQSKSIFAEKVSGSNYRMRVAMPDVREGSVIDIVFSYTGFPSEWYFQDEIPVAWSELYIEHSAEFNIRKNQYGYEKLATYEDGHYIAVDVPAFKKEPYMNSWTNYITKMEFDLRDTFINGILHFYVNTWDDVCKVLMESDYFGGVIVNSGYLSDMAKEIKTSGVEGRDRIEAAYEKIKTIKWNKDFSIFSSENALSLPFKKKIGNSADININLYKLLKLLNIKSELVVASTRDNGLILPETPVLNKLNNVIVAAYTSGDTLLLDATDEYSPFDLLPFQDLNWHGHIVKETGSQYISLEPVKASRKTIFYDLTLDQEMQLNGKYQCARSNYAAVDFRKKFASYNSQDEYITGLHKINEGLTIKSASIKGIKELKENVMEEMEVSIKGKVEDIGGELYIYPLLYENVTQNPFKTNDRIYPVDFGHQIHETVIVNIHLPEGYEVATLPKSVRMQTDGNGASLTFLANSNSEAVNIKYAKDLNKTVFLPKEYSSLQGFFNQIVSKHSEPVILRKKEKK